MDLYLSLFPNGTWNSENIKNAIGAEDVSGKWEMDTAFQHFETAMLYKQ